MQTHLPLPMTASLTREHSPVGSGKTALLLSLCQHLRTKLNLGVVTNDIFTRVRWCPFPYPLSP